MQTTSAEDFEALYQRAQLLYRQRRYADAAEWFQRALRTNPQHGQAMAHLALSWAQHESTYTKALEAARQAVAVEPDQPFSHVVQAITLLDTAKPGQEAKIREGLAAGEKAVQLAPEFALAHAVCGNALLKLRRYAEAEAAARRALALDTTDTLAAQILSHALLAQRKDEDLKHLVEWQLQENPEDDSVHVSAGFRAFHEGRHREANEHFRQALRIDPGNEAAREGLIESFRSRSFIYRWFVQFSHFMRQFGEGKGTMILVGGYIAYRLLVQGLQDRWPAVAAAVVAVWLTFVLWTFLARGIASLLMLTDRFARLAIRAKERWEGLVVGGFVVLALICLASGFAFGNGGLLYGALTCALAAVPAATAFSNGHHLGRWVYAAAAGVAGVAALLFLGGMATSQWQLSLAVRDVPIWIGVAATWCTMLRVLYR